MSNLPVLYDDGTTRVFEPATGDLVPISEASDRAILEAVEATEALRGSVTEFRYALGAEMRERHGIGTFHEAGYGGKVQETTNWPLGETQRVLRKLYEDRVISRADLDRALPLKPKPDGVQIKALIGRLTTRDPKAAIELAQCATISSPSIRDLRVESVPSEAIES